jgi:hypothetical protein
MRLADVSSNALDFLCDEVAGSPRALQPHTSYRKLREFLFLAVCDDF